jgi:hypothetical protein
MVEVELYARNKMALAAVQSGRKEKQKKKNTTHALIVGNISNRQPSNIAPRECE